MPRTISRRRLLGRGVQALGLLACVGRRALVGAAEAPSVAEMTERAVAFLRSRQDAKGGWSTGREPGITAIVVTALLRSKRVTPADPAAVRALAYLEGFIGPNGGLSEAVHANYTTAIALMAFHEANVNGRYDRAIKAGQEFLTVKQWDEGEGKGREDAFYGGAGYGGSNSRPDLSNTAFFMEALRDTGLAARRPGACRRRWSSSRAARTSRASSTTSPGRARSTTAASSTRRPTAARAWRATSHDGGLRSYAEHDLRRPQEHDPRRPDPRRPPRQGRVRLHRQALHRRREPGPRPEGALLLLPDLRQGVRAARTSRP